MQRKTLDVPDGAGAILVVPPGGGEGLWQPEPANGHVTVKIAPDLVAMEHDFSLGTQTIPPGCFVREHAHADAEEVLFFLAGRGRAVLDGVDHPVVPGTAIFVGRNRWHSFVNDGEAELHWMWMMMPHGLEKFFRAIGRPRAAGEPAPVRFPRPADVLAIERATGFAPPRTR